MSNSRKLFTILLSFLITCSSALAGFSDVPEDHPQAEAIEWLQEKGVSEENANFYPRRPINLAEFIAMGLIAAGLDQDSLDQYAVSRFEDVPTEAWFTPYVTKAEEFGMLSQFRGNQLLPKRTLTRGEAAELGLRIFGKLPLNDLKENFGFTDLREGHRLHSAVTRVLKLGAMDPLSDTKFGITEKVSRAEAAKLFYQLAQSGESSGLTITINGLINIPKIELLEAVWEEVRGSFLFEENINEDDMLYQAVGGAVDSLGDPYSEFLTPEETAAFNTGMAGEFEGIGIHISKNEAGEIEIITAIKDSPAQQAGLEPGDIIEEVDSQAVIGMSLAEVAGLIRGERGTQVKLTIRRDKQKLEKSVTRALVELKSVELTFKNNIAILSVSQFGDTTAGEFEEAASKILEQNPKGLIVDLRNNGGGLVQTAVNMLGYFLPQDSVVAKARFREIKRNLEYVTFQEPTLEKFKTVVLINRGSASASEIVAAALQDYGVATLVGEKSFGKGTMQELSFFTDGTALKLTIAHWLSPNEQAIDKNGVTPDIESVDNKETENIDEALETALGLF